MGSAPRKGWKLTCTLELATRGTRQDKHQPPQEPGRLRMAPAVYGQHEPGWPDWLVSQDKLEIHTMKVSDF